MADGVEVDRRATEQVVMNVLQANRNAPRADLLQKVTDRLHELFSHYTGVYIYLVQGDMLVLTNHRGRETEHTRIPIGAGICGRAARVKETVTVDDVNSDPDYIACSLSTRSEIVVPILRGDTVFGEIDIDSDIPGAFDVEDRRFLEQVASQLAEKF